GSEQVPDRDRFRALRRCAVASITLPQIYDRVRSGVVVASRAARNLLAQKRSEQRTHSRAAQHTQVPRRTTRRRMLQNNVRGCAIESAALDGAIHESRRKSFAR